MPKFVHEGPTEDAREDYVHKKENGVQPRWKKNSIHHAGCISEFIMGMLYFVQYWKHGVAIRIVSVVFLALLFYRMSKTLQLPINEDEDIGSTSYYPFHHE